MNTTSRIYFYLTISVLSLFFAVQGAKAHTDSLKIWRFVYEVSDVNYTERGYNDLMNLDVQSDGSSLFYSVYQSTDQSAQAAGADVESLAGKMDSKRKGARYKIFRDAATTEMTCTTDAPDNFYYKEDAPRLPWNISAKDTMTVCGYVCKKATAVFAGRTWIAWFSDELPISGGPWKLSGLPGLILSAYDSDDYFRFSCIGMEQTMSLPWEITSRGYIKCTNDEYQKQLRLHAADPVNYALRKLGLPTVSAGEVTIIGENGKPGKELPKFTTVFMEKLSGDSK